MSEARTPDKLCTESFARPIPPKSNGRCSLRTRKRSAPLFLDCSRSTIHCGSTGGTVRTRAARFDRHDPQRARSPDGFARIERPAVSPDLPFQPLSWHGPGSISLSRWARRASPRRFVRRCAIHMHRRWACPWRGIPTAKSRLAGCLPARRPRAWLLPGRVPMASSGSRCVRHSKYRCRG